MIKEFFFKIKWQLQYNIFMKKPKFVYFDIGGVFIDYKDSFNNATEKFGIPKDIFNSVWIKHADQVTRGKVTPQEFWHISLQELGIKKGKNFDFLKSWIEGYKPINKTHELAKKVSKKYPIGILSNLYAGMMPVLLSKKLVPNLKYSAMVISAEVGLKKPELEIYKLATKKSGVLAEEILFIDDREDFVDGARKSGWQTFRFNEETPEIAIKELEKILL